MSSKIRLINSNDDRVINRLKQEEWREKRNQEDRIREKVQIIIQERKKIREIDDEKEREARKEIIANIKKETQQGAEEHRLNMEKLNQQGELTKEIIKKSSDQIKAFRKKLTDKQKIDIHINELTSYLNNNIDYYEGLIRKIKGEKATPMKELVETLKGYLLEIKIIKGIDNKRPLLDLLYQKIKETDKIKEDLDKSVNIITSSGGSKLPVKRRANAKPKTKPKAKPKAKPRSNKGVR
jgi:hypothetical protein